MAFLISINVKALLKNTVRMCIFLVNNSDVFLIFRPHTSMPQKSMLSITNSTHLFVLQVVSEISAKRFKQNDFIRKFNYTFASTDDGATGYVFSLKCCFQDCKLIGTFVNFQIHLNILFLFHS